MIEKIMDRPLEHRFQQWVNRQCADHIKSYERCVSDKWPWQLYQCQDTLDAITKCRLSFNTKREREVFLERERTLLSQMDDNQELTFDHDLYVPNTQRRRKPSSVSDVFHPLFIAKHQIATYIYVVCYMHARWSGMLQNFRVPFFKPREQLVLCFSTEK